MGPLRAPCIAALLTPPSFLLLPFHVVFTFTAGIQPGADPHFCPCTHTTKAHHRLRSEVLQKFPRRNARLHAFSRWALCQLTCTSFFHQSVKHRTVPRERGRIRLPLWKIAPAYVRLHSWHSRHNCPSDVSVMSVYSIHPFGVSHSVLVLCGSKQYEKNTPASQRNRFRSMLRWWDHTHTWVYLNTCKPLQPIQAARAQPAFAVSGKTGPDSCRLMPHRGWWKCSVMADRSRLSLRDGSMIYGCQE